MTNIVIRSDEANAAATALLLATRNHKVSLSGTALDPGHHTFRCLGEQRTATLHSLAELNPTGPKVAMVFAEGESAAAGIRNVLLDAAPELLVMIGGGITAVVEATQTAAKLGFDAAKLLHIGGFLVGGNAEAVTAEKSSVVAGFLAAGTPPHVVYLALSTFPQLSLVPGPSVALSSVGALVHVPPMILNAMSVERGDDVRFYREGFGDSVGRLLTALDEDRIRLGGALGLKLATALELMDRTQGPLGMTGTTSREKVNAFPSYEPIRLPATFRHRFLAHELQSTFAPMLELAKLLNIDVPTIQSVVRIGEILIDDSLEAAARIAAEGFLTLVRGN
ncbi:MULTISPECIES: NAD/NADP octopine/nopaline dehydrogenase family protein [unclassified Arthrobacter]|uniref:NAD/NADP octopine/nopaline dehydrogenase family protein n=1 Tax=unclassified Arthrobacter TaxID=235627 RepID=UPI0015E3D289|nr:MULTISPECIES: NAD/NADP octopine/nopaline dehydrogenase family protein [unclassified Arthrobacter]